MAENATLARPYARAAFEYAQESGALAGWSEFLRVAARVVADERVEPLLDNPHVEPEQLANLVLEIAGGSTDEHMRAFALLLARNQRLGLLPEVSAQYEALRAEIENTVDVTIISAVPLSEEQQAKLSQALHRRFKRTVRLHCQIEPSLIGGAIVRAGDFVMDGSLKGKLERLGNAVTH